MDYLKSGDMYEIIGDRRSVFGAYEATTAYYEPEVAEAISSRPASPLQMLVG